MNTRSLYFRLILWYSGLVIVVSVAFGAYLYEGVQSRLYRETVQTLTRRAHQIADNLLSHADQQPVAEIARQIEEVYSPAANHRFIRVSKGDGDTLYSSKPLKDEAFDPARFPLPPVHEGTHMQALPTGGSMLIVNSVLSVAGRQFLIEMGATTTEMQTALHGLIITLLIGLPCVAVAVSAGGYLLVRRSLKLVENIRATAEKITLGNLSNRLPVAATGDELQLLSVTLNQMLQRLDDSYQQVSRFSADASHELRTPLTIMRGELESIIQRETDLGDSLRERIGSVLEETERLSRITESLFALSRQEAGDGRAAPSTFSLAGLVESTADQMLLLAEVKSIALTIEAKQPTQVSGDATKLKQVIVNLLDNAIKYTPPGGKIAVVIGEVQHKACLSVSDTGIGIAADDLPHIFERFYRADKARSREEGGAGLGLSIVRSIAQQHGGIVEAESGETGGATFRVFLPLAEAHSPAGEG
jgi:heavy metal sensor kinase